MAFSLCEKDNIQWVTSDVLGTKHLFSRRLGDVGDFPFSSKPDPEWESESRQERVRALWQRFRTAAEFPAEGFCFTRQVHGTVLRYVTEAERAMPPLPHPPEDCDGLITDRKDVPLCVWTADCVPVLFRDPKAGIVAAAHSGWKGTVADMMGSVVRRMEDMGARAENIRAAAEDGKTLLCICGGYQLLGNGYRTAAGQWCDYTGILDFTTEGSYERLIGNYAYRLGEESGGGIVIGFENHGGRTDIKNETPLGKVLKGYGNDGKSGFEGVLKNNVFATYLHGPLLPKNPQLADIILKRALIKKYGADGAADFKPLSDGFEHEASRVMQERLL